MLAILTGGSGSRQSSIPHSRCAFVHMSHHQGMARNPDIPHASDVYTLVVLRRPADAPAMSHEEIDALQARHLAYRAELASPRYAMPSAVCSRSLFGRSRCVAMAVPAAPHTTAMAITSTSVNVSDSTSQPNTAAITGPKLVMIA